MRKLSPFLITILLVSCGNGSGNNNSSNPRNIVATNQSTKPIPLTSDRNKSLCSVENLDEAQRNLNLSLFVRGQIVDEDRNFSGLIDGLKVRDIGASIITESSKDLNILYTYTSTDDVVTTDKKIINPQSAISICADDGKYARASIESAALNATYFISKTGRKVSELLPSVKIPAIEVEIGPLIKKSLKQIVKGEVVWTFEAFDTDNAYYSPGENKITFLPHSEEFKKAGMTMNFWEVPMVASHEYGHHIFEILHPYNVVNLGMKNCFGKMGLHAEPSELGKRSVTTEDVLGALNEGFADLVSFYSLDNNERGLKGVPCLEISRDVGSGVFADGTSKIFSTDALATFFLTKEVEAPETCDVPNYQDIHIIGAIFANGADRLLSLSVPTKDQRLSIVLSWLQEMKVKSSAMNALSPQDFLRESFELLVQMTAKMTDGKVDQSECDLAKEIYPEIDGHIISCMPAPLRNI